jgi:hypothetical protein
MLADLSRLLEPGLTPAEFFGAFLQRALDGLHGVAGAVWTRTPQDNFQLEHQLHLAAVGLDQVPNGRACHAALLRRVVQGQRPVLVPPHHRTTVKEGEAEAVNLALYAVLLAPIVVDDEVAGVVEVWQTPAQAAEGRQAAAQELAILAGIAAAYLHRSQWRQLQDRQQLWGQLETFARQIHGSLNPREVAYLVANEGRPLVGADQVSVALAVGATVEVEAISGASIVEKRSRLVQAMRDLFARVMTWGEPLIFTGGADDSLPPLVRKALDAYLAASNSRLLIVQPLRDPRGKAKENECRAALLAECFHPAGDGETLQSKLHVVAEHATSALHNAVAYRRVTARWWTRGAAWLRAWTKGKRARKAGLAAAVALLVAGILTLVPAELRFDAHGQLLPKERQIVFAHLHGKVVEMKAQHGDRVDKGQELLFIEDLESQLKIDQLALKAGFAEQRLAMLGEQLARITGGEERNALVKERINQEYELRKAIVERNILLQGSLNPRKASVAAPLAGKVVTFDSREQLVGKTVKPGDPLLRIACVDGPWEIELLIPEGRLAPLREGMQSTPDGELNVQLLLASHPLRTFQGRLRRDGLGGETTVKDNAVVLPVRVQVVDPELLPQLRALPVGLEVHARVQCGPRALGRVWFGDLVEFFYEHLWF